MNKRIGWFWPLVMAGLMTACGGGGGGDDAGPGDPPPVAVPPVEVPPVVEPPALAFDPAAAETVNIDGAVVPRVDEPRLVMLPNGDAITAYLQSDGTVLNVFARRFFKATGQFGPQEFIGKASNRRANRLRLAASAQGTVIATWQAVFDANGSEVVHVARYAEGKWSAVDVLSDTPPGLISKTSHPAVAVGPAGEAMVVWQQTFNKPDGALNSRKLMAARLDATGSWTPEVIYDLGAFFRDELPQVVILPGGDAIVAVAETSGSSGQPQPVLYRHSAGGWKAGNVNANGELSFALTGLPPGFMASSGPRLIADASGLVIMTFPFAPVGSTFSTVFAARLAPGATRWSDAQSLGDPQLASNTAIAATAPDGSALIAWLQTNALSGSSEAWSARFKPDGKIEPARQITAFGEQSLNAFSLSMSLDTQGNGFLVADQEDGSPAGASPRVVRFDSVSDSFEAAVPIENDDATSVKVGSVVSIAAAADGTALALWAQGERVRFNRRK